MRWALALSVLVLAVGACEKEKEIVGVDRWSVKTTRLADAMRCIPETMHDGSQGSYCFGQQPFGIKGMAVDIDLYFGGTDPEATLVEIQMKVGGCRPDALEEWMRKNLGAPFESSSSTTHAWKNRHLYAAGFLPLADEPGRCLVRIVPVTEEGRWQYIWKGASPGT